MGVEEPGEDRGQIGTLRVTSCRTLATSTSGQVGCFRTLTRALATDFLRRSTKRRPGAASLIKCRKHRGCSVLEERSRTLDEFRAGETSPRPALHRRENARGKHVHTAALSNLL